MANPLPLHELKVITSENFEEVVAPNSENEPRLWLIDKPYGWSSFKCVKWVRKTSGSKKVGHAGTLDPMATGLVVCAEAKATKSIDQIQSQFKVYRAEISLGATTPSQDAETEITDTKPYNHVTLPMIENVVNEKFLGEISQIPPMYSALSKDGVRLYKLARQGLEVERASRTVTVYDFQVHSFNENRIDVTIKCSKGTYIRTIAYDLAIELRTLGYLTKLRRTQIGDFTVKNAINPET